MKRHPNVGNKERWGGEGDEKQKKSSRLVIVDEDELPYYPIGKEGKSKTD